MYTRKKSVPESIEILENKMNLGNGKSAKNRKGLINGNGLTNGNNASREALSIRTEGLINGTGTSRTLTLHKSSGLVNGNGFTNGNGLTNGNGITNGNRLLRKQQSQQLIRYKNRKQRLINLIIVLLLIITPLSLYLFDIHDDPGNIQIDEEFEDWNKIEGYRDSTDDQLNNPNINIVEYRVLLDKKTISFFIEVYGNILQGQQIQPTPGSKNFDNIGNIEFDNVHIFIDSDSNSQTGYQVEGFGADYLVDIKGYNGKVMYSQLKKFDFTRDQFDWNGWVSIYNIETGVCDGRLETQVTLPEPNLIKSPLIRVHVQDFIGNEDLSDCIVNCNEQGALIVKQKSMASEILTKKIEDILELELTARGSDITITSIDISKIGSGKLHELPTPITIKKDVTQIVNVELDISTAAIGDFVNVFIEKPEDIKIESGLVTLSGIEGAKRYVKTPPSGIKIDGAFADWGSVSNHIDTDASNIGNANIDLTEFRVTSDDDEISFYFKVDGVMMGGTKVPIISESKVDGSKTENIKPREIYSSIQNINNDQKTIFSLPELFGNDAAYIYFDIDLNENTGYHSDWLPTNLGADYLLKVTGKNGIVNNKGLYRYNEFETNWDLIRNIEVGKDINRLETQVQLKDINFQDSDLVQIYFLTSDWSESHIDLTNGLMIDSNKIREIDSSSTTRANNPYTSSSIHPRTAQNSDSEVLSASNLDDMAPGDSIYEKSGDTNEPNADWIEVTFPTAKIPSNSMINNITYYYGYYTNAGWALTTDPLSNITWNAGATQFNLYNYTLSSPPDSDVDASYSQLGNIPSVNDLNSGSFSVRFRGIEDGGTSDYLFLDYCYFKINYTIPEIVINEIMFNSTGNDNNSEWVELYNAGNTGIDLTGWNLTDNDGTRFCLSGAGTIPAKGYLICHLGQTGTNSSTDVYSTFNRSIFLQPASAVGKDASIWGGAANEQYNFGVSPNLRVSGSGSAPKRVLIEFDLATIPSKAVIDNAKFQMYKFAGGGGTASFSIHQLNHAWGEGYGHFQSNSGSINGTTWLERWYGNNANNGNDPWDESDPDWATTGGDYKLTSEASANAGNSNQWVNWTVTNIVQKWVNNSISNYGLIIVSDLDADKELYSSDYTTDTSLRPKITINYTLNTMLENDQDDLALLDDDDRVIDYVAWGADPGEDDDKAVAAGQWDNGDFVSLSGYTEGDTLGRDGISTDTDQPADWENSCGINMSSPTPGCPNIPEFSAFTVPIGCIFIIFIILRKKKLRYNYKK